MISITGFIDCNELVEDNAEDDRVVEYEYRDKIFESVCITQEAKDVLLKPETPLGEKASTLVGSFSFFFSFCFCGVENTLTQYLESCSKSNRINELPIPLDKSLDCGLSRVLGVFSDDISPSNLEEYIKGFPDWTEEEDDDVIFEGKENRVPTETEAEGPAK
jgi:hypothetical protein